MSKCRIRKDETSIYVKHGINERVRPIKTFIWHYGDDNTPSMFNEGETVDKHPIPGTSHCRIRYYNDNGQINQDGPDEIWFSDEIDAGDQFRIKSLRTDGEIINEIEDLYDWDTEMRKEPKDRTPVNEEKLQDLPFE